MIENTHNLTSDEPDMPSDWSKFEYHVLAELKRLNSNIEKALIGHEDLTNKHFLLREEMEKKNAALREEIVIIKTNRQTLAMVYAFGGSIFGAIGISLLNYALTKFH